MILHIPAVIIVEIKLYGVDRIQIRLSCIGGDLAHNQADNLTGYLLFFELVGEHLANYSIESPYSRCG